MRLPIRFTLTTLLLVGAGALAAQSPPNLSGRWVLLPAESTFGPLPAPESRTDLIVHEEPRLVITRATVAQGQEVAAELSYLVDGEPHRNHAGGAELVSRLHWEGATLVMISLANSPQGEVTITDRYELSADGQTLIQHRTLSVMGQELAQRLVLKRQ